MKTDIWLTQIDNITRDFRKIFGALTDEQLNWSRTKALCLQKF